MYVSKTKVEHYTYPWKNGKRGSNLQLENTLNILPLIDEFEDTISQHSSTTIELIVKIKEDK
jgi:hypothetical protein